MERKTDLDVNWHGLGDSPLNKQVGADHYKKYKIQPTEYNFHNRLNNLQSAVVDYITRYKDKNGEQDLDKAIHCIELLKEFEYGSPHGSTEEDT